MDLWFEANPAKVREHVNKVNNCLRDELKGLDSSYLTGQHSPLIRPGHNWLDDIAGGERKSDETDIVFFVVDNKYRRYEKSTKRLLSAGLRKAVGRCVGDKKARVKLVWTTICDELKKKDGNPYCFFKDVCAIAAKHGVDDEKEVRRMLAKFHELGVLVYFGEADKELGEYVVLQPQWVVNYIREIICFKTERPSDDDFKRVKKSNCRNVDVF